MGKGFNNYMCKKFFHPGSIDNLKRVWMAQQKTDAEKKKQEELKAQYDKEQELYNNKALLAKGENKEKLSLNFMYEPPAGMKKEREREDGEPEYKFEWQRKYNGPRESYLSKDDDTIRDQPFGIQVRNVRCIKCKKWGHINTDKECELYTAPWELTNPTTSTDPLELMQGMRDNGLALKAGVVEGTEQIPAHQLVASDDGESEEETEEMKFIKSLSQKDKLKLLKKLSKLQKKKKKKQKKKSKSKKSSSDSDSSSEDDNSKDKVKSGRKKHSSRYSEDSHDRARNKRRHHSEDRDNDHKRSRRESDKGEDGKRHGHRREHEEAYIKQEGEKHRRGSHRSYDDSERHHHRRTVKKERDEEKGHKHSERSRSDSKRGSHKQR
ncbi:corepressor interacting with RBPJ 1-like [Amphibalanus amphitrite]|uniref:corepressor interacting with RBPJ 1-like n=1 Tax=Amphibalanus amphitrite TaxID=1232801 RepID=UPI001C921D2E|nr:corepressor interacting with RBPJ 1-like [Amphibalanus amphitrite]XP_043204116.1 corepressor interacting with RBPJ 1-like [Amphibalanus amphitrite]